MRKGEVTDQTATQFEGCDRFSTYVAWCGKFEPGDFKLILFLLPTRGHLVRS